MHPCRQLLLWTLLSAAFLACHASPAPSAAGPEARSPTSATSASAPAAAPPPPEPPAANPLAAMRARGPFHVTPMAFGESADTISAWLVFLGSPEVARAAWWVELDGKQSPVATRLEPWPAGARVLGSAAADDGRRFLFLESAAVLDQPAGILSGLWIWGKMPPEPDAPRFAGARSVAELEARVRGPALRQPTSEEIDAVLATARGSLTALAAHVSHDGVDIFHVWQHTFPEAVAHLDATGLAKAPAAPRLLEILGRAHLDGCLFPRCPGVGFEPKRARVGHPSGLRRHTHAAARDARAARSPRVGHAAGGDAPSPPRAGGPGRRNPRGGPLARNRARIKGTVTVALVDGDDDPALGGHLPLRRRLRGLLFADELGRDVDVRFADVDGDHRTDVLLRARPAPAGAATGRPPSAHVYLTPRTVALRWGGMQAKLGADMASALYVREAATINEAVGRALQTPARAASADEMRALEKRSLRAAMMPGAPIFFYDGEKSGPRELSNTLVG